MTNGAVSMVKGGIKTSEFWVTVVASNLLMFSNALGIPLTEVTAGSIAVMVVGYIWSRLSVKKAETEGGVVG